MEQYLPDIIFNICEYIVPHSTYIHILNMLKHANILTLFFHFFFSEHFDTNDFFFKCFWFLKHTTFNKKNERILARKFVLFLIN